MSAGHAPRPHPALPRGRGERERAYPSSTQVSLVPPPWLELTTREPSLRATRVRPPGTMRIWSAPESTKGRRSTWRGATPGGDEGRAGRERQRRLGDEAVRRVAELAGEILELALRRMRADQHAVAARAVDLLHHELGRLSST